MIAYTPSLFLSNRQTFSGVYMEDILSLLHMGLQKSGSIRTAATLGDRSTYIGMSDIGKGVDCLRAAVAGKLSVQSTAGSCQFARHQEQANLQRELRLQRGHWFEAGVLEAFRAAGQPFIHQLTISSMNDVPVIAHPDFVFADGTGEIHVVELKSCENIPESAYAAHEVQLFGQMGLMAAEQTRNPAIDEIRDFLKCATLKQHDETGTVAYCWDWLKWYPEFPEVAFVEAFMEHLNSIDSNEYLFIRVGESEDDTEYRGGFWENPLGMSLTREITFDA
jgi:hypothetical protein